MDPKKQKPSVDGEMEKPIAETIYHVLDTDLARDNVENDIPFADLQDI